MRARARARARVRGESESESERERWEVRVLSLLLAIAAIVLLPFCSMRHRGVAPASRFGNWAHLDEPCAASEHADRSAHAGR